MWEEEYRDGQTGLSHVQATTVIGLLTPDCGTSTKGGLVLWNALWLAVASGRAHGSKPDHNTNCGHAGTTRGAAPGKAGNTMDERKGKEEKTHKRESDKREKSAATKSKTPKIRLRRAGGTRGRREEEKRKALETEEDAGRPQPEPGPAQDSSSPCPEPASLSLQGRPCGYCKLAGP